MDITEDIGNDRSKSFITLDNTMLSRNPLMSKPSQPLTARNSDTKGKFSQMNISRSNLDLLDTNFNLSREGTFLVSTMNSKKTPINSLMSKQTVFRTIEEAKI